MKEIQSFTCHAKWCALLLAQTFSSMTADINHSGSTLAVYMGYFDMLALGKVAGQSFFKKKHTKNPNPNPATNLKYLLEIASNSFK